MSNERTKYEAELDVDYAIVWNRMHVRFYKKIRFLFNLIFIAGGAAIFADFGEHQQIAGMVIAISGIFSFLIDPSTKAAEHDELYRRWLALDAKKSTLELVELDRKSTKIRTLLNVHGINAINTLAYNANLARHGFKEGLAKRSPWTWLVGCFA